MAVMKYGDAYKAIVENLYDRPLTLEDGFPEEEISRAGQRLSISLPQALREYYLLLGRFHQLNQAHNCLLMLDQLQLQGKMLRFMDENQGVCTWALPKEDLETDNPIVYQGYPIDEPEWYSEELSIFEFLELSIYLQSVWGGLGINGNHLDASEVLAAIETSWEKVVDNAGLRIWHRDQMLISHLDGDTICVCAAGNEKSFEFLERKLGFERQ